MRKLITLIVITLSAVSVFAWTNGVSTVSSYIAPAAGMNAAYLPVRTNGMIVGTGQYVRVRNSVYMSAACGTTTNDPYGIYGWTTRDDVSWIRSVPGNRSYFAVCNYSTSIVTIAVGRKAVVGEGIRLGANETWEPDPPPQSSIQAITSGGAGNVAVVEW